MSSNGEKVPSFLERKLRLSFRIYLFLDTAALRETCLDSIALYMGNRKAWFLFSLLILTQEVVLQIFSKVSDPLSGVEHFRRLKFIFKKRYISINLRCGQNSKDMKCVLFYSVVGILNADREFHDIVYCLPCSRFDMSAISIQLGALWRVPRLPGQWKSIVMIRERHKKISPSGPLLPLIRQISNHKQVLVKSEVRKKMFEAMMKRAGN